LLLAHMPPTYCVHASVTPAMAVAEPRQPRMSSMDDSTNDHLRPSRSPATPKHSCPRMEPMMAALATADLLSPVCCW
jgi:hypothetical protein